MLKYLKYLKCRRVTESENIITATSKNGRLMRRGQCVTCGKTKIQFVEREAAGGCFLNTLVNKLPFECIYQDINLLEQNSIKD